MLRALAPNLAIAALIVAAAGTACAFGAPVWVIYLGSLLSVLAVVPAWERWEHQHRP